MVQIPGQSVEERKQPSRRGTSFNQSEIMVITALLARTDNDPAWSGEREAKALASLRKKFRRMTASFDNALVLV